MNISNKPTEQEAFIKDLQHFITNHPYYKSQQGELNEYPTKDQVVFNISDPDGDYEGVNIKVSLIA